MLTVKVIDTFDQVIADVNWRSASARHNLMADGGWEVVIDGDPDLFKILQAAQEPLWAVLIDHSSGHVHGGPIRDYPWSGPEDDGVMTLSGPNANWYANRTITLPVHTQTFYPGESSPRAQLGYTRGQQHGSRSIYELVDDQMNNTGLPYRNFDVSLTAASLVNTGFEPVSLEAEPFEPLMATVRRWGLKTGVIADWQWRGASSTAELSLRLPVVQGFRLWRQDGQIVDWEFLNTADTLNYPWIGGAGEGVNRAVTPVAPLDGVPARWGLEIERFVASSSTADGSEAFDAAQLVINDNKAVSEIRTKAVAAGSGGPEFAVDYLLGDICSAVFLGTEYLVVIEGVTVEWSVSGKAESIATGLPDLAIYNQPGVTLGEQPPVVYEPSAGLAVGYVTLRTLFDPNDPVLIVDTEIVYAAGNGNIADQATLFIEERVDGGAWTQVQTGQALGTATIRYGTRQTTFNWSPYASSLEVRARLEQTGETTVYSPVLLVAEDAPPDPPTAAFVAVNDSGDALLINDNGDELLTEG